MTSAAPFILSFFAFAICSAANADNPQSSSSGIVAEPPESSEILLHKLRLQLEADPLNVDLIATSIGVSLKCRTVPFHVCGGYRESAGPFNWKSPTVPVFSSIQRDIDGKLLVEYFLNLKGASSIDGGRCITGEQISKEFESGKWLRGRVTSKFPPPHGGSLTLDSLTWQGQTKYSVHLSTSLSPYSCSGFININVEEEK